MPRLSRASATSQPSSARFKEFTRRTEGVTKMLRSPLAAVGRRRDADMGF